MTNETVCILILLLYCLGVLCYLIYRIKKEGLRPVVIDLILEAEDSFEKGKNREKMEWVIEKVLYMIPKPFQLFLTVENVENFIQRIFDEIKEVLDYGNQ